MVVHGEGEVGKQRLQPPHHDHHADYENGSNTSGLSQHWAADVALDCGGRYGGKLMQIALIDNYDTVIIIQLAS